MNETPNTSRLDRKRDTNKRRISQLPHLKNKIKLTTSKIISLSSILGKTFFKKKGEVKKTKLYPPSNYS